MTDYYLDLEIKQWEKERGKIEHSDPALYGLDDNFINSAADRYRAHQKKQYEQEESRLLSQRILWTDILRQGNRREYRAWREQQGDVRTKFFIEWYFYKEWVSITDIPFPLTKTDLPKEELKIIDIELNKVRNRLRYLSMPKKELKSVDIALVKSVPLGNLYDMTAAGFFVNNPLRQEKSPSNSLHWNKNNNTWKDFGSDEGGDNIDMVMRDKKCGFKEACEHILRFI